MVAAMEREGVITYKDGWTPYMRNIARRWCQKSLKPTAKPPSDILSELQDIGFNEEAAVVYCWGDTKLDFDTLGRVVRSQDSLTADRSQVQLRCRTQINLARFLIDGLALPSYALVPVHRIWYPAKGVDEEHWHQAWWDTNALRHIFKQVRKDTRGLYEEHFRKNVTE
ncbi:hypothetical protein E8E13_001891 [Curvularia kusanoi]|uniref:Uncharacterized protein n=1 Tax=Curvularia kusanoi TaxID=90978 RepID=A0A9P4WE57_CURKU|nr:hypothetical protein E8E13_001891 [Curvularia kusanoi]